MIPRRPDIVIRSPPEKGMNNPMKGDGAMEYKPSVGLQEKTTHSNDYAFVLYTNMNKCKYSSELLEIVENNGMMFEVKDVSKMSSIPSWLKGTPVIEFNGEGFCGDLAFNFVECLSTHFKNISTQEKPQEPRTLTNGNSDDDNGCSFKEAFSGPSDCGLYDSKYDGTEDLQKVMDRMRR